MCRMFEKSKRASGIEHQSLPWIVACLGQHTLWTPPGGSRCTVCGVKTRSEFIKDIQNKITGSPEGMEDRIEWSSSWADLVEVDRPGKTAEKDCDVLDLPPGLLAGKTEQGHFKQSLNQKADSKTDVLECPLAGLEGNGFLFLVQNMKLNKCAPIPGVSLLLTWDFYRHYFFKN